MVESRPKTKVLIYVEHSFSFWCFPEERKQALEKRFPNVKFILCRSDEEVVRELSDTEVYFGWRFKESWLHHAGNLKWIHSPAAGVRRFMKPLFKTSGLILTNSRGVHAIPMAEHTLGYMLFYARKAFLAYAYQKATHWGNEDMIASSGGLIELFGKTVLIVGYGAIGQAIGIRAKSFGMNVLAIRRHPEKPSPGADKVGSPDKLFQWLPDADFVVLVAPSTRDTDHLFSTEAFQKMKTTACLINIARGRLVDERALIEALRSGKIACAILDVFEHEPLPPDHPFWKMENVIVTPHIAGVSTEHHWDRILAQFSENLERYLQGKPLLNVVSWELEY